MRRSGAHPLKALQRPSVVLSRCQCFCAESLMGTAVMGGAGGFGDNEQEVPLGS